MIPIDAKEKTAIKKTILLRLLDLNWREHLQRLEHLRQIVGLRGFGQRDPLNEYKNEAFELFEHFLSDLRKNITSQMVLLRFDPDIDLEPEPDLPEMELHHEEPMDNELELALSQALPNLDSQTREGARGTAPQASLEHKAH